jgi:hypothetical protein
MLDLDAPEWRSLTGGYRVPYDASLLLKKLETASDPTEVWDEIWNELHHRGDVGTASFAAAPWLLRIYREKSWIDFNLPNYIFALEDARSKSDNPPVPEWLAQDYQEAVEGVLSYCLSSRNQCDDPDFRKAVVLLTAALLGAFEIAELVDCVETGDEKRALALYIDAEL